MIYYYHSDEIPLFLLAVYSKARKGNITPGEKAELKTIVRQVVATYRGEDHE